MPTCQWLRIASLTSCSCSALFWVGWVLSHSPFSKPRAEGIATAGNFGRQEGMNCSLLLKLPIPLVRTFLWPKHVTWSHPSSGFGEVRSHQTPERTNGDIWQTAIMVPPFTLWSQSILFTVFYYMQNLLIPFPKSRLMHSIHSLQPERQDHWVM